MSENWHLLAGFTQVALDDGQGTDVRTFVPEKTFNVGTRYQLSNAVELGGSWRWQDKIHQGNIQQEPYSVLAAYLKYAVTPHIKLALNINNLTDEKYLTSLYWSQSFYAAPRNASASLNITF